MSNLQQKDFMPNVYDYYILGIHGEEYGYRADNMRRKQINVL